MNDPESPHSRIDGRDRQTADVEMSSGATLRGMLRHAWIIVGCVLLAAGLALLVSQLQTKQYTADASLLFRDPGFDQEVFDNPVPESVDADREAATNLRLVSLDVVADLTAADLPGDLSGSDVSDMVAIESDPQSDVVTIQATDESPAFAAQTANTFARNYIEFRRDADRKKIEGARRLLQDRLEGLNSDQRQGSEGAALVRQIGRLRTLESVQTGNAELVQKATVPTSPSAPQTARNVLLASIVGLVVGLAVALAATRMSRKLRDSDDFEAALGGLPVLASIPDVRGLHEPDSGIRELMNAHPEAVRMLRARLRYFNPDREFRSVLVTSPAIGEGKTTIAWSLAASAAAAGTRTVLVEADLHRPRIAERAGALPSPGLSEVLRRERWIGKVIQSLPIAPDGGNGTAAATLDVIVAGSHTPAPGELLEGDEMRRCIESLESEYELVVIDTPPISRVADAIPLLAQADGVLVVVERGRTTRDEMIELDEQLRSLGASVLGIVANRVSPRGRHPRYYGEYVSTNGDPPPADRATLTLSG